MMNIKNRLKQIRIEKNLSQTEVAKAINVDVSSISYWESGRYEPKATYIYKLSQFFEVSSDYLLGLEDEAGRKTYDKSFNNQIMDNHGIINQTIR